MKPFTLLKAEIVIDWTESGDIRALFNGRVVYQRLEGAPCHEAHALDAIGTALALATQRARDERNNVYTSEHGTEDADGVYRPFGCECPDPGKNGHTSSCPGVRGGGPRRA